MKEEEKKAKKRVQSEKLSFRAYIFLEFDKRLGGIKFWNSADPRCEPKSNLGCSQS